MFATAYTPGVLMNTDGLFINKFSSFIDISMVYSHQVANMRFAQIILQNSWLFHINDEWPINTESIEISKLKADAVTVDRSTDTTTFVVCEQNVGAICTFGSSSDFSVRINGRTLSDAKQMLHTLKKRFPREEQVEPNVVMIGFWSQGRDKVNYVTRKLRAPSWDVVRSNYTNSTLLSLEETILVSPRPNQDNGKLILWFGPPGVGKTYAIRALALKWASWCRTQYVVDPEIFFGSSASYLLEVLLNTMNGDNNESSFSEQPSGPERQQATSNEKWRLIVLEDTGELLATDAKTKSGQGLSRLLNVVDGILGQGLPLYILITTNEDIGKLHPAVARPGRCAWQTEFCCFNREEAVHWLQTHSLSNPSDSGNPNSINDTNNTTNTYEYLASETSLAQLYAISRGSKHQTTSGRVGFRQ